MLKKILSGIISIIVAIGTLSAVAFAETEETVLFTDNFESGLSTNVWDTESLSVGTVVNNKYKTTASTNDSLVISNKEWKNISATAKVAITEGTSATSVDDYVGIMARYYDASNYVLGAYSPFAETAGNGTIYIKSVVNGTATTVASKEITAFTEDTEYTFGVSIKDSAVSIVVNGDHVLKTAFDVTGTQLVGSVALKSNNVAATFDDVQVSGTPYYFVENFNSAVDWSGYNYITTSNGQQTVNASYIKAKIKDGEGELTYTDGKIKGSKGLLAYIRTEQAETRTWDDVEMTVKLKSGNGQLNNLQLSSAVDGTTARYHIDFSGTKARLRYFTEYEKGIIVPTSNDTNVAWKSGGEFLIKYRLTDMVTDDGKPAVRIRLNVDGKDIIDYTDDGSKAQELITSLERQPGTQPYINLMTYPRVASSYSRGFVIETNGVEYTFDYITISDPREAKLDMDVSLDKATFNANEDVTATLKVDNKSYETSKSMFITAVYDGTELVDVKLQYPDVKPDQSSTFTQTINVGSGNNVKTFLWDSWKKMIPVITPVTAELAK
ncbi:MAG: hypothetical protein IKV86_05095 [Clostridia bacterium]|nr:hypothetical protein [Clostridia bacterium]